MVFGPAEYRVEQLGSQQKGNTMTDLRTVTFNIRITDENVNDIAETAGSGIYYWAGEFHGDKGVYDDGVCFFHEFEEAKDHVLTADQIRDAFVRILSEDLVADYIVNYARNAVKDGNLTDGIDCGHVDAELADVIVQIATFGELVYG